ncbi:MAG: glycine cleavage system protein T [Bdellovibrionaceae bacterium]|nr:glycine cleavage system protein T [Pseudobdellovibrionaceae bacterium]
MKRTPLAELHEKHGAKMVDFAGWWMPVQFKGLKEEHLLVREKVGLFDVSHMGEIRVKGPQSLPTIQWLLSNDASVLTKGKAQYTLLTNHEGGIVDDLIVYCIEPEEDYLLCVNAANIEKDFQWILENNKGADITNESEDWAQIAIQGPKGVELTSAVFGEDLSSIESFSFAAKTFAGVETWVARTGYTGEDGFEVFVPKAQAAELWTALLEKGAPMGVEPIGLGARDTLRTEKKYPLYGHEINDSTNPYEAGLGWVTKVNAKDFVGKSKIVEQKEQGLARKLVGFKMLDRGIARQGYQLLSFDNKELGEVTSGTPSPSLNENIGIGYVLKEYAELGTEILVQVRARQLKAQVVQTPFVK